jgi:hypothetical protein
MGTLSNPAAASGAVLGTPVLYGPYSVDYTDIPHDGDKVTLWTPQVGDVLLKLFPDRGTCVQWDHGVLAVGQNVDVTNIPDSSTLNYLTFANAGGIGNGYGSLDFESQGVDGTQRVVGSAGGATGHVFHTTDPVQIQLAQTGGTDPGAGHVEIFALVARAVAP